MIIRHREMTTTTQKTGKEEHLSCSYTGLELFVVQKVFTNINEKRDGEL